MKVKFQGYDQKGFLNILLDPVISRNNLFSVSENICTQASLPCFRGTAPQEESMTLPGCTPRIIFHASQFSCLDAKFQLDNILSSKYFTQWVTRIIISEHINFKIGRSMR